MNIHCVWVCVNCGRKYIKIGSRKMQHHTGAPNKYLESRKSIFILKLNEEKNVFVHGKFEISVFLNLMSVEITPIILFSLSLAGFFLLKNYFHKEFLYEDQIALRWAFIIVITVTDAYFLFFFWRNSAFTVRLLNQKITLFVQIRCFNIDECLKIKMTEWNDAKEKWQYQQKHRKKYLFRKLVQRISNLFLLLLHVIPILTFIISLYLLSCPQTLLLFHVFFTIIKIRLEVLNVRTIFNCTAFFSVASTHQLQLIIILLK